MTSELLSRGLAVFRERLAHDFGCDVSAFDSHALTIVQRPPKSREKYIAMATTLGTGTVLSVDPEFFGVLSDMTVEKHFQAFNPQSLFLPIFREAERRGIEVVARNPGLGFLLEEDLPQPPVPEGLTLERWERDQCEPWAATFHNALWDAEDLDELHKFRYAIVLTAGDGSPRAMAGAWDEARGLIEIGVDVAHDARGMGLGPVIVRSLARAILDSGSFPTYYCAATNVRSHRTALASGFVPVITAAGIRMKPVTQQAGPS